MYYFNSESYSDHVTTSNILQKQF